ANGCGGFIFCGSCTSPQTCGATGIANVCGLGTGAVSVGPFGNGSGRVTSLPVGLDCTLGNGVSTGTCRAFFPVGTVVNLNAVPAPGSSFIGFIPNKALCPASVTVPAACQVGFVLNCTPTSCFAQGKNCGTISDGCGGTLTCGVCTAPQTCGGGGLANVCGASTVSTTLLTLTATGRTGESVSSSPIGLKVNVGTIGSASFATGTVVTLSVSNGRD